MTVVYLIRHSQPMREHLGSYNGDDIDQTRNEKNILTPEGEKLAEKLAQKEELQNIDVLYSSNYVRTMSTAKYIAYNNEIDLNIDDRLGERKFGYDSSTIPGDFFKKQWLDFDYKHPDGESINDTKKRITEVINEIINNNKGKTICIVSHGTALSSYLLNILNFEGIFDNKLRFTFNGEEVFDGMWNAPHMFKLVFDDDNNLIEYKNIGS